MCRVCCEQEDDEDDLPQPVLTPLIKGPFTKTDQICVGLWRLHQRCRTTDTMCGLPIFSRLLTNIRESRHQKTFKTDVKKSDSKIQEASGATVLLLDGCVKCPHTVFLPDDPRKQCPLCGQSLYNNSNNNKTTPNEVCMYVVVFW